MTPTGGALLGSSPKNAPFGVSILKELAARGFEIVKKA
jgi:hypothetical protein